MPDHALLRLTLALALALALAACGGSSSAPDGAPSGPDGSGPDPDAARGSFQILEIVTRSSEGDRTGSRAFGTIAAADAPSFHREAARAGDCRLLTFAPALCDPFCNGICVDTNVCVPFPTYVSAGLVTVAGLTVPLTLRPEPGLNFYNPVEFPLPEDLFAAGAEISATASGAEVPAFTLAARGVATLVADIGENLDLVDGADLTVTWTPAGQGARVRLTLNAPNQGHGLPFDGIIECDAADDGSLTIARELVEAFPDAPGNTICVGIDCPLSSIVRYTRGIAEVGGGAIELVVGSAVEFGARHQR